MTGGAWVSCCLDMIEMSLEDVASNKLRLTLNQQEGLDWRVIAPIIIIASVVLIFLVSLVVCTYKGRYSHVNQQYV